MEKLFVNTSAVILSVYRWSMLKYNKNITCLLNKITFDL